MQKICPFAEIHVPLQEKFKAMAGYLVDDARKVTTHRLIEMKQQGKKIAMLTAYDYTMARIVDGAGMDIILVGDSASNVMAATSPPCPSRSTR